MRPLLRDSLTVEQRTLNPSVVVRIHLPQLRGREAKAPVFVTVPGLFVAYMLRILTFIEFIHKNSCLSSGFSKDCPEETLEINGLS